MLRGIKRAFVESWNGLRRPSRREAPDLFGLEKRTLLSGRVAEKAVLLSVDPLKTSAENRMAAAKASKQVTFVKGLYRAYLHRAPSPAQLNYALEQLNSGVSHAALKREIMDAAATSSKKVSAPAFVNGLYGAIGSRSPTPVGQAYWLGLLKSGVSRKQVSQMFQASNGMLPPPTITWYNPASIVYGTPLSSAQLNAFASVPGTFTYSSPAGTLLDPFYDYPLSVTFTPTDSADYPSVSAAAAITVYAAPPTITWLRPHAIQYGTPLSDIQLNATATWIVNGQTVNVPGTFTYSSPWEPSSRSGPTGVSRSSSDPSTRSITPLPWRPPISPSHLGPRRPRRHHHHRHRRRPRLRPRRRRLTRPRHRRPTRHRRRPRLRRPHRLRRRLRLRPRHRRPRMRSIDRARQVSGCHPHRRPRRRRLT